MIDIFTDELLTLEQAASILPVVGGKKPTYQMVWAWASRGAKNGARLDCARIGKRYVTTRAALAEFCRARAERPDAEPEAPQIHKPRKGRTK